MCLIPKHVFYSVGVPAIYSIYFNTSSPVFERLWLFYSSLFIPNQTHVWDRQIYRHVYSRLFYMFNISVNSVFTN